MVSLEELQKNVSNKIVSIKMIEENKMFFLRMEISEPDLDKLTEVSRKVSEFLDSKDVIKEEYFLDIQSTGTDKTFILSDAKTRINKNVKIVLKKPLKDKLEFEGKLLEVKTNSLIVRWNAKGQFRKQEIENENINKIFDSAVIKKEK